MAEQNLKNTAFYKQLTELASEQGEISLLDKQIECYTTQQVIAAIKEKCDIDENILLNMLSCNFSVIYK